MTSPVERWMETVDRLTALPAPRRREMLDRFLADGSRLGIAPLTYQQESIWFQGQLRPEDPSYLSVGAYRLRGHLRVDRLVAAVRELADRHDALRSVVFALDGRPLSATLARGAVRVRVVEVGEPGLPAYLDAEAGRPFVPEREPLFRATLVTVGPGDHVLLLIAHHLVVDGRSMAVLFHDLAALYRSEEVPPLPIGYADFARWQRGTLTGDRLAGHIRYWRDRLAGMATESPLPVDRPDGDGDRRAGRRDVHVPAGLLERLRVVARAEAVTMHQTLLAGLAALLARLARCEDVLLGVPVANRSHPQTEGLVGLLVTVVPFPVRPAPGLTGRQLLRQIRDTAAETYAHEELPLGLLVEHLRPAREGSGDPLVHVLLDLDETPGPGLLLDDVEVTTLTLHREGTPADLAISLGPGGDGLTGTISYDGGLFDASTVDGLLARWLLVLEQLAADPGAPVGALRLTTPAERTQLLAWGRG